MGKASRKKKADRARRATAPATATIDEPKQFDYQEPAPEDPKKPWAKPWKMHMLDVAFPAHALKFMPAWDDIPDTLKAHDDPFNRFAAKWFFKGVKKEQIEAKDGIDFSAGLRHIKAVLGSFEPKHEHKIAAVAYLLSQWFILINPEDD